MTAPHHHHPRTPASLCTEQEGLLLLRDRYQQGQYLFSARELARLVFLRWLYQAGRLQP